MSSTKSGELLQDVVKYVEEYMSHFDASHDFNHIKRVVSVAHIIYHELEGKAEAAPGVPQQELDYSVITLSALLHDVGDRKYLKPGENEKTMVRDILLKFGTDVALADKVQAICSAVSYSSEVKDLQYVRDLVVKYPELGVVQDADRLDAIGAIGIGRVFAFGAAKTDRGLASSVEHFEEKLLRIEGLMKTGPGKRMAAEKTERLKAFRGWWDAEIGVVKDGAEWFL
jgi:uncharacterized protein